MPLFIAAGIAAAGTLGAAYMGSQASNKAADATGAAAASATAEQARQFNIGNANQQPWLTTGSSALQKLAGLYGLDTYTPGAPGSANGAPGQPGGGGQTPGMIAAQAAGPHSKNPLTSGIGGAITGLGGGLGIGRKNASPIQDIAGALALGRTITDAQWAQAGFGPGGSAQGGTQPGSANGAPQQPAGTFTSGASQPGVDPNASFYQSPDYQFRLTQGLKGLEARAATGAFGGLDSGALRKAEIDYSGNLAAGDYNSYANRLAAIAGVGQTTATNLAGQGQTYATNVGNIATNQGNNRASSYLANGQTYGNTVGNLAGIGAGLITNGSSYTPASGGTFNGTYMAPYNSAAAAAGY